jgi:hypothetical protein
LSSVFVPIFVGDRLRGSLTLESFEREDAYDDAEVKLLSTVASSMGVALENARLLEETQRRAGEASALAEVGRDLSSSLDPRHCHEPHRRPREGPAEGRQQRDLRARSGDHHLPRDRGGRRHRRRGQGHGRRRRHGHHRQHRPERPARARQRRGSRSAWSADSRHRAPEGRAPDGRPLVADGAVEGAMAVWRTGGQLFDDRDLQFLAGLSRQAMVALRNARLFNGTKEALEQQTATADILRVISNSPTSTQPVFDAILESRARLCESDLGLVVRYDAGMFWAVATLTPDRAFDAFMRRAETLVREDRAWPHRTDSAVRKHPGPAGR